jgi:hypothetical protein
MKLINLTNDPSINIYLSDGSILTFPQMGCLRVNSKSKLVEFIKYVCNLPEPYTERMIPVMRTEWIREEIPPLLPDTMYIVSSLTAMAIRDLYPERHDFICPNTHPDQVVKQGKRVVGTLSFQTFIRD